jgi:hypothetical protein
MAKVDFKLNDSLLRRQRADVPAPAPKPSREAPGVPDAPSPAPAAEPPANRRERRLRPPAGRRARGAASVQTSVLLPPSLWDHLKGLASDSGGVVTPNRLLVDVLASRGPHTLEEAAEDLDRFLSLPAERSSVGGPWEERNVRLPIELRQRLDELRGRLAAAGLRHGTRAHLMAATLLLRGPSTGEEARAVMSEQRAEALRRALAVEARAD